MVDHIISNYCVLLKNMKHTASVLSVSNSESEHAFMLCKGEHQRGVQFREGCPPGRRCVRAAAEALVANA